MYDINKEISRLLTILLLDNKDNIDKELKKIWN